MNFLQGNLLGNKRQGATGQLLWVPHPSLHNSSWVFQWRGDLCSIQEFAPHGTVLYVCVYVFTYMYILLRANAVLINLFRILVTCIFTEHVEPLNITWTRNGNIFSKAQILEQSRADTILSILNMWP